MIHLGSGCFYPRRDPPGHTSTLVLCGQTEWRGTLSRSVGTVFVCSPRLLRLWCLELVVRQRWTQKSILRPVKWRSTSQKSIKVLLTFLNEFGSGPRGANENFHALCTRAKHTLPYGTLSRPPIDSVLTVGEVGLVSKRTPSSFSRAISTSFQLYDCRRDMLLDDLIIFIVSRECFVWQLFNFCLVFVFTAGCPLERVAVLLTVSSSKWCDRPASGTDPSGGYSSMIVYCASWTTLVLRRKSYWGLTHRKRVTISTSWTEAPLWIPIATWSMVWHKERSCCLFLRLYHLWYRSLKDDSPPDNKMTVRLLRRYNATDDSDFNDKHVVSAAASNFFIKYREPTRRLPCGYCYYRTPS